MESWTALLLRVGAGAVFVVHGLPEVTGRDSGGLGRERLQAAITAMGFPAPPQLTYLVGLVQAVGGLLLLAGLGTTWAAAVLAAIMVVATGWMMHKEGFGLGADFPFALLMMLLALVLLGDGRFSLAALLGG